MPYKNKEDARNCRRKTRAKLRKLGLCLWCRRPRPCKRCNQRNHAYLSNKFYALKYAAKKRNIPFDLTKDEYSEIRMNEKCYWCGEKLSPWGHGIDRKNNELGYIKENSVPCCGVCNRMKQNHSIELFLRKIRLIVKRFSKQRV